MAHELTAYAAEIRELRKKFVGCELCAYKQMGLRRLKDAELFLAKDTNFALSLIDHAKAYLGYAQEYTQIQQLRKEALARVGLSEYD